MKTTHTFALAVLLLVLALLVATSVALASPFANSGESPAPEIIPAPTVPSVQVGTPDATTHFVDGLPWNDMARTETFTVSSGGTDVFYEVKRDADGEIIAETRTWMVLPDEDGYRAYVTETKGASGEFIDVADGKLYDPDADGVAGVHTASTAAPRHAAVLD